MPAQELSSINRGLFALRRDILCILCENRKHKLIMEFKQIRVNPLNPCYQRAFYPLVLYLYSPPVN